jgi:hypothetical protein
VEKELTGKQGLKISEMTTPQPKQPRLRLAHEPYKQLCRQVMKGTVGVVSTVAPGKICKFITNNCAVILVLMKSKI